jgi:hypothetical protein
MVLRLIMKRIITTGSSSFDAGNYSQFSINPWLGDALLIVVLASIILVASFTLSRIEKPWRLYGRRLGDAIYRNKV